MNNDDKTPLSGDEEHKGKGLQNLLKLLFLVAVLVASWFLLDRLINK